MSNAADALSRMKHISDDYIRGFYAGFAAAKEGLENAIGPCGLAIYEHRAHEVSCKKRPKSSLALIAKLEGKK